MFDCVIWVITARILTFHNQVHTTNALKTSTKAKDFAWFALRPVVEGFAQPGATAKSMCKEHKLENQEHGANKRTKYKQARVSQSLGDMQRRRQQNDEELDSQRAQSMIRANFWLQQLAVSKESSAKLLPILFLRQLSAPKKLLNANSLVAESFVFIKFRPDTKKQSGED